MTFPSHKMIDFIASCSAFGGRGGKARKESHKQPDFTSLETVIVTSLKYPIIKVR